MALNLLFLPPRHTGDA